MKAKDLKAGQRFELNRTEYIYLGVMEGEDLVCARVCGRRYQIASVLGCHTVALVEEPSYSQRQSEWVRKHGLKVGDKVKVLRSAEYREDGWRDAWLSCMNEAVGKEYVVDYVFSDGIRLGGDAGGYGFPYFVLEPVVAIDPGEGYRILGDDEVCKEGDEYWSKDLGDWGRITSGVGFVVGLPIHIDYNVAVRRKKEPTYRPYTAEEAVGIIGKVVIRKGDEFCIGLITGADRWYANVSGRNIVWLRLFHDYTFQDGATCGVEVKS